MQTITQEIFSYGKFVLKLVCKADSFAFKVSGRDNDNRFYDLKYSTYLVLEHYNKDMENWKNSVRTSVYFSFPHMYGLKSSFASISDHLATSSDKIFDEIDDPDHGRLVAVSEKYSKYVKKTKGAKNYIAVNYDVYENETKNTLDKGVKIYIVAPEMSIFMPEEVFMSLDMVIQELNLHSAGLLLVNTMSKSARPSANSSKNIREDET